MSDSPADDVEARLAVLERGVARLREQVAVTATDAAAARVLAGGADWTTPLILEAVGSGKDLRHGSSSEVPG